MRLPAIFKEHEHLTTILLATAFYTVGNGAIFLLISPLIVELINAYYPAYIDYQYLIVGLFVGLCYVPSLLFDVPTGELCKFSGKKRLIHLGLSGVILFSVLLPFVDSLEGLFALLMILGFSNQLINVPTRALVMEVSPSRKTAECFGLLETGMQVGYVVAAIAGGVLLEGGIMESRWMISTFSVVMSVIAFVLIHYGISEAVTERKPMMQAIALIIKTDRIFMKGFSEYMALKSAGWAVFLLTLLYVVIDGLFWSFEPLYYTMGIETDTVGLILAMFTLPFILFQFVSGYLADRFGKTNLLFFGLLIAGTFLILFGLTRDPDVMLVTAFVSALGLAMVVPAYEGLLTDVSSGKDRGCVVGVWDTAEDLGYIIAPIMGGLIAVLYRDVTMPFVYLGAITLLLIVPVLHVKRTSTEASNP